jgi:hypothetical protein
MACLVLIAAAGVAAAAHAQELQFTVDWGADEPGVVEIFDVNASIPGTPSATSEIWVGTYQDIDFAITNDNLGNTVLQVGDDEDSNWVSTGTSDFDAFFFSHTNTNGAKPFYNGSSLYLQASPGETAYGVDGTQFSISAVAAAPEPSTWALMMAGIGGIGMILRGSRNNWGDRVQHLLAT